MSQFTVHENLNKETRNSVPYLVDVQNDLLEDLHTRVVIPPVPFTCPWQPAPGDRITNF